jgi:hypothetical protein
MAYPYFRARPHLAIRESMEESKGGLDCRVSFSPTLTANRASAGKPQENPCRGQSQLSLQLNVLQWFVIGRTGVNTLIEPTSSEFKLSAFEHQHYASTGMRWLGSFSAITYPFSASL